MALKPVCHAFAGLLLALALCPSAAAAQNTGYSYPAAASATIVSPLTLTVTRELDFGRVFSINNGGSGNLTVTPNSSGEATYDSTEVAMVSPPTLGEIQVSGTPNSVVSITLPGNAVALSPAGSGSETAQIWELLTDKPLNSFALDGSGNGTVYVGGRLSFSAGRYGSLRFTGSFSISFNYQ